MSKQLHDEKTELLAALEAALEWIDAVPPETPLPAMPGFDRDWIDSVVSKTRNATAKTYRVTIRREFGTIVPTKESFVARDENGDWLTFGSYLDSLDAKGCEQSLAEYLFHADAIASVGELKDGELIVDILEGG